MGRLFRLFSTNQGFQHQLKSSTRSSSDDVISLNDFWYWLSKQHWSEGILKPDWIWSDWGVDSIKQRPRRKGLPGYQRTLSLYSACTLHLLTVSYPKMIAMLQGKETIWLIFRTCKNGGKFDKAHQHLSQVKIFRAASLATLLCFYEFAFSAHWATGNFPRGVRLNVERLRVKRLEA